jgi:hypothetical protein
MTVKWNTPEQEAAMMAQWFRDERGREIWWAMVQREKEARDYWGQSPLGALAWNRHADEGDDFEADWEWGW